MLRVGADSSMYSIRSACWMEKEHIVVMIDWSDVVF